jgi:hypothetical protein
MLAPLATSARAQSRAPRGLAISGYAMAGHFTFDASQSFDAIVGSKSAPIFGGGVRVALPLGGLFVDAGASRLQASGERVFLFNDQVIKLGIPVDVTLSPVELSAGWRFVFRRTPKLIPYAAVGVTLLNYRESSALATAAEDTNDSFRGYHAFAGVEYKFNEYVGLAGESAWLTVPDAIGESGVSAAFNESNLGGTTFRLKITIGR